MNTDKGINIHELKCWPEYFGSLSKSIKTFDLRKDDRGFGVGDKVVFEEYRPGVGEYTGRQCSRRIVNVLRNFDGLMPGYCILGLAKDDEITWLPMETAPRNGTTVRLALVHSKGVRAYWDGDIERWVLNHPLNIESIFEPTGWAQEGLPHLEENTPLPRDDTI